LPYGGQFSRAVDSWLPEPVVGGGAPLVWEGGPHLVGVLAAAGPGGSAAGAACRGTARGVLLFSRVGGATRCGFSRCEGKDHRDHDGTGGEDHAPGMGQGTDDGVRRVPVPLVVLLAEASRETV
jgi:hypothetical protein